jgi:hypothetical protein
VSELHFLIVFDTETGDLRVAGMNEAPVDSDEYVWDPDKDEWRIPTDEESDTAVDVEGLLIAAVHGIHVVVV